MVALSIVYDSGMDDRVMEVLSGLGVKNWTKTFGAHGSGGAGCKLDSAVFPGTNLLLTLVLTQTEAEGIAAELRSLQGTYRRNPGLALWTTPARLL